MKHPDIGVAFVPSHWEDPQTNWCWLLAWFVKAGPGQKVRDAREHLIPAWAY